MHSGVLSTSRSENRSGGPITRRVVGETQRWRRVEKLKNEASRLARARVTGSTDDEPEPEYARMHLAHVALMASEDTGVRWAQAMNHLLDQFDARAAGGRGSG